MVEIVMQNLSLHPVVARGYAGEFIFSSEPQAIGTDCMPPRSGALCSKDDYGRLALGGTW
jgi:hypothetical protein